MPGTEMLIVSFDLRRPAGHVVTGRPPAARRPPARRCTACRCPSTPAGLPSDEHLAWARHEVGDPRVRCCDRHPRPSPMRPPGTEPGGWNLACIPHAGPRGSDWSVSCGIRDPSTWPGCVSCPSGRSRWSSAACGAGCGGTPSAGRRVRPRLGLRPAVRSVGRQEPLTVPPRGHRRRRAAPRRPRRPGRRTVHLPHHRHLGRYRRRVPRRGPVVDVLLYYFNRNCGLR